MLQCPTCKKPVHESTLGQPGSTFPFCSDRCRLRDLGKWFDGAYQIPVARDESNGDADDDEPLEVWVDPNLPPKRRSRR